MLSRAAHATLSHFAPSRPHAYDLVWTANASAALNTLTQAFPFQPTSLFVYATTSHTSVVGCRNNAAAKGATFRAVDLEAMLAATPLNFPIPSAPSLVVFPCEDNFTGFTPETAKIVRRIRELSPLYSICLDVAKFSATHPVDLHALTNTTLMVKKRRIVVIPRLLVFTCVRPLFF